MKKLSDTLKESEIVSFTVPLVPPSVNHYVKHTHRGEHYLTEAAETFYEGVWVHSARRKVRGKFYEVTVQIYLGKRQKGDTDNFLKCIGDGLQKAGVIDRDSKIAVWHVFRLRDSMQPRTVITVRAI